MRCILYIIFFQKIWIYQIYRIYIAKNPTKPVVLIHESLEVRHVLQRLWSLNTVGKVPAKPNKNARSKPQSRSNFPHGPLRVPPPLEFYKELPRPRTARFQHTAETAHHDASGSLLIKIRPALTLSLPSSSPYSSTNFFQEAHAISFFHSILVQLLFPCIVGFLSILSHQLCSNLLSWQESFCIPSL